MATKTAEIIGCDKAAPWMADRHITPAECKTLIERYHTGDDGDICVTRWSGANYWMKGSVNGKRLAILVRLEETDSQVKYILLTGED